MVYVTHRPVAGQGEWAKYPSAALYQTAYRYCSSWNFHCMKFSLISVYKCSLHEIFTDWALLFCIFLLKNPFSLHEILIGSDSQNSEMFMQWIISWSTDICTKCNLDNILTVEAKVCPQHTSVSSCNHPSWPTLYFLCIPLYSSFMYNFIYLKGNGIKVVLLGE